MGTTNGLFQVATRLREELGRIQRQKDVYSDGFGAGLVRALEVVYGLDPTLRPPPPSFDYEVTVRLGGVGDLDEVLLRERAASATHACQAAIDKVRKAFPTLLVTTKTAEARLVVEVPLDENTVLRPARRRQRTTSVGGGFAKVRVPFGEG